MQAFFNVRRKNYAIFCKNYFNSFYEENCNVPESKKEDIMIKEDYWVDILQGIQEVNNKYVEYSFTYENAINN